MKLSVCSEARVMPCSMMRAVAGLAGRASTGLASLRFSALFSSRSLRMVTIWPTFRLVLSPASVTTILS